MIKVLSFTPTEYFGSNCFLINSDGEYAVVDPSVEYKMIEAQHPEIKGNVKYILLTHCHFDHILYTESWVAACPNALVVVGENDGPALANPMMNCFLGFLGIYDGYNGKYPL